MDTLYLLELAMQNFTIICTAPCMKCVFFLLLSPLLFSTVLINPRGSPH